MPHPMSRENNWQQLSYPDIRISTPHSQRYSVKNLEALLNHLKIPVRHRRSVRTTNLIERSFEEEKRRTS